MQGPHCRYLTNSYVQALGLEPFVYAHREPFGIAFVSEHEPFPVFRRARGFDLAVVYNHGLYLRRADGLSWDHKR